MACKLFKITLSYSDPDGSAQETIFWGYHQDEAKARDAALHWASKNLTNVASITKVDIIP